VVYSSDTHAEQLTFLSDRTRTRRDHEKYLTLIDTLALLHQYQRPVRTHHGIDYVEVTVEDIAVANRLAHEVLGRTLDELPPQTRILLGLIQRMVTEACTTAAVAQRDYRFSRRAVRAYSGWGHTQLQTHLRRLEALEYLLVHRGGRGQSFVYELLYDGAEPAMPHLAGLLDVTALAGYDAKKTGLALDLPGSKRRQTGAMPGGERGAENTDKTHPGNPLAAFADIVPGQPLIRGNGGGTSYPPLDR
jgi:hypothetical protein